MRTRRGAISLADLAIALAKLRPDDPKDLPGNNLNILRTVVRKLRDFLKRPRSTYLRTDPKVTATIVDLLGLERAVAMPIDRLRGVWEHSRSPDQPDVLGGRRPPASVPFTLPPARKPQKLEVPPAAPLETTLTRIQQGDTQVSPPEWVVNAGPLDLRQPIPAPMLHKALFEPLQTRGILGAALATRSPDGPLDIGRIVASLVQLRPLKALPRLPVPTLRRGAQLLLDRGEAMIPFIQDLEELRVAIEDVVGQSRLEVLDFVACPGRKAGSGPQTTWRSWSPPPAGMPVIIATDLGIGGPFVSRERADSREWCEFAQRARGAGCPVIAFVPFAPQRWPREVSRWITLVHWDRRTTAGVVRRSVGPGHQVQP